MPLDFTHIAAQVGEMIRTLKDSRAERRQRLENALKTLNDQSLVLEDIQRKLQAAKTSWLVAELTERLDRRYSAPLIPSDFTVMATDGSHIDVDRHRSARCYLINIGSVGQPRDRDNRASYAFVEENQVHFVRLEYDFETTVKKILAIEQLDDFHAERLKEGR